MMLDDQSNHHNCSDPLEDYMASFFRLPADTPSVDSAEVPLGVPLNSSSILADNSLSKTLGRAHSIDHVDGVTAVVSDAGSLNAATALSDKTSLNIKARVDRICEQKPHLNAPDSNVKPVNFTHDSNCFPVFKKGLAKPFAQHTLINKPHFLLDNQQKKNLQKLLDKSLNQPLLEHKKDKVYDARPNVVHSYLTTKQNTSASLIQEALGDMALTSFKANDEAPDSGEYFNAQQDQPQQIDLLKPVVSQPVVNILAQKKLKASNPEANEVVYRSHWLNNKPAWAQNTFDALLFQCRGVTLAIPLISLGYIYLHNRPLKKLPNLPSWVLGIKPLDTGQLKVIDAGAYFFPERTPSLNIDADLHLLSLADCLWGFAVDSLSNPIRVEADDVQWRSLSANNPWLAGTIKKQMCVLIDLPALLVFLNQPSI